MQPLWTKNFTIITIGSIASMLGSAAANFALGLLIFEKTQSTFLYSFFFVACMLPNLFVPLFAGVYLDAFPRKKIIVCLDTISGIVFILMSAFLAVGYFNYTIYLLCGIGVGIIMSIYQVAYESFYPNLISKGNFSKAYSIGSILYPICNSLMVPIAAYTQQNFGFAPLFFFNGISYWIAAVFEATIQIKEQHVTQSKQKTSFTSAFLAGFHYLKQERALWYVTWYFTISTFAYGVCEALQLPFFSSHPSVGVTRYALLISMSTLGRFCGGLLQYKLQFPPRFKYHIALFVYGSVIALEILFFRLPYLWLPSLFFLYGLLGATSFNIRISATQSYIPDHKRARFNSIFMVLTSIGLVCGQLLGGILGEVLWIPNIVLWVMLLDLAAVYVLFVRNKTSIQPFYNRKV